MALIADEINSLLPLCIEQKEELINKLIDEGILISETLKSGLQNPDKLTTPIQFKLTT